MLFLIVLVSVVLTNRPGLTLRVIIISVIIRTFEDFTGNCFIFNMT